jgi:diguanylate cyclase (GGDEF)-like protein
MRLIMVPVVVISLLGGSAVYSHRSAAAAAEAIDAEVDVLGHLISLRDALQEQSSALAFDIGAAQFGVPAATGKKFVGFDWAASVPQARVQASDAIAALGSRSPLDDAVLRQLYIQTDSSVSSLTQTREQLAALTADVEASLTQDLDKLELADLDKPLTAALESLREATGLVDAVHFQIVDLTTVLFPLPDGAQAPAVAMSELAASRAHYETAAVRLRQLGVDRVVAQIERIEADPDAQAFEQAVTATLAGTTAPRAQAAVDPAAAAAQQAVLAQVLHGYFVRQGLFHGLIAAVTSEAHAGAKGLAASERAAYLLWLLFIATLAVATVGVALRLGRSISQPLKELAVYAHAITNGQLDAEPAALRHHGPRETQVAFSALSDLVANLRLLDAKANALANCDFDSPALREPLPGRLGRSLESSVTLLSGSIVERDELQTHLAHEATHDALTGLGNRPAAITAIHSALTRSARAGETMALLFIDLNEFKAVNDGHGHEAGDAVLRHIASRLSLGVRATDFVARLGGDEFVVIAESIADVADATDLAHRLIDAISEPIAIGAIHVTIGAAIGIAMPLDGPEDALSLLGRADAAMYRAKHHERSAIEVFDADLQRQLVDREEINTALAAALADPAAGGLHLNYQPVLDAATGAMVGVEALIRWDRGEHGLLAPDSFIPIAERTALITDLDCWVLAEAARQQVAWSAIPELANVPVAVNISGRHLLSRQLPGHIRAVLEQTGINPHHLSIEVTETVLLSDLIAAAAELDAVRAMGVRVAIDDFGTGYTSLAHLQQLPIDTIKIDRSFISQLNARRGSALVRMVTDLGHAIEVNIVAEGVETGEEMSALQAMGADHLQGFLLCRPLTPAALTAWAHDRRAAGNRSAPAA